MIPLEQYSTISPEDSVTTAVKVIINSYRNTGLQHRTILVVSGKKLVGLLTMRNLLEAMDPALFGDSHIDEIYHVDITPAVELFALEQRFADRCRENCCTKVKDVMQPLQVITINHDDSLLKAIHLMLKNHINSLPVLDNDDVVGIIRVAEIVEEIHDLVINSPECKCE